MIHNQTSRARSYLLGALSLVLTLVIQPVPAAGQSVPDPVRERLLNGLEILFWNRPGDANVLLKLRIRSGAAFDFAGRGGLMALLGDVLFPDPATREYVSEQLGGRLEVATDYDAIDVTISGKAGELERIVDLLRGAVVTPQLSPENVALVREARLKQLKAKPLTAPELADQAIAARLLGRFPYGHPASGTVETVAKIDRADLMLARERFLHPDNATLVVVGGVEKDRAMRALRQLIGPWIKSDRAVPNTFRQPEPPDARVLVLNQPGTTAAEVRLAVRGLARSDRDAGAASLVARVLRDRWKTATPDLSAVFVRHEAHTLPGIFVLGASAPAGSASQAVSSARQAMQSLSQSPPTLAELDRARHEVLEEMSGRTSQIESIAEVWLNIETFRLASHNTQANSIRDFTPADIQRVATRLFKDAPVATVVVGNSEQLKAGFERVEIHGESSESKTPRDPAPAKKP